MKKPILIASAALIAMAIPAIAAHHEGGHMMMTDMNRTAVEAKVREYFATVDANKDGAVTTQEIEARRAAKRAKRLDERFKQMDSDSDGSISRAEFDAGHARRHEKMGAATSGGGKGMHGRMGHGGHSGLKMLGGKMFEKADANKDAKVTLAEATRAALMHFDQVDADKNGTVTSQERTNYWKTKKDEWKAKKDGAS